MIPEHGDEDEGEQPLMPRCAVRVPQKRRHVAAETISRLFPTTKAKASLVARLRQSTLTNLQHLLAGLQLVANLLCPALTIPQ